MTRRPLFPGLRTTLSLTSVVLALASSGCTALLGSPDDAGEGEEGAVENLPLSAAPSDLRRLGKLELGNSVRALLPALPGDAHPAADVPKDNNVALAFSLPGTVSEIEVKRFMDLGEEVLTRLGANAPSSSVVCGGDEATCARDFVADFAGRAFRRPATPGEVDDLMVLYDKLRTDPEMAFGFAEALDVLVEAILQSPGFLYRWERGPRAPQVEGELVKYDSYEMASRLSYFLWNTMPDEELLVAAQNDELATPDQVEAQTRRMIADARFDQTLGDFATQWLELSELPTILKDTNVYPAFVPGLGQAMLDEARAFVRDVFRSSSPTLDSLLHSTASRVSPELANFYGVAPSADGVVDLGPAGRQGILMQSGFLAAKGNSYRTSPVRRGKLVLNRLLCIDVPPPPPNAVLELPPPDPNLTLREQMAEHAASPGCATCHETMDPLGFAFEHFDGAGSYRELEGNLPIDATGSLEMGGDTWSFDGAPALIDELAKSREVHDCFARQWLRYALDRFEQPEEKGAVTALLNAHEESGLDWSELLVEITRSKPFSHRALRAGEVTTP